MKFNEPVLVVSKDPGMCLLIEPNEEWGVDEIFNSFDTSNKELFGIPVGEPTTFVDKMDIINNILDNVKNHGYKHYSNIMFSIQSEDKQ